MLESTGSHGRGVEQRVLEMRRMVEFNAHRPNLCEQSMTRLGRSTLLRNSKAPEQMTAECWHWRPRWNWLASSTSCFGSSACLQSSSSVLCKTAYGLESPKIGWVALMLKALAIQINWQFTGGAGIMQVEHTADCFEGTWFKSPLLTEVWHPRHIWRFQFAEELALNGETYVVSVNKFSATCYWQIVGVQGARAEPLVRGSAPLKLNTL